MHKNYISSINDRQDNKKKFLTKKIDVKITTKTKVTLRLVPDSVYFGICLFQKFK